MNYKVTPNWYLGLTINYIVLSIVLSFFVFTSFLISIFLDFIWFIFSIITLVIFIWKKYEKVSLIIPIYFLVIIIYLHFVEPFTSTYIFYIFGLIFASYLMFRNRKKSSQI